MPARPNVPNVFKVAIAGTVGPYNWAIILHAGWSGTTPSLSVCNALAGILDTGWSTYMSTLFTSTVVMDSVTLTDLTSNTGASGSSSTSHAGTNGGTEVAANTAVLVNYPSSFRYRGGHPRTYLPPPPTSSLLDTAHLTTAATGTWGTAWANYTALLVGSTSGGTTLTQQCAVSYFTAKAARVTPVVMPISGFTLESKLASQRRRIGRK